MKKSILLPFLIASLCIYGQSDYEKTYFSSPYNDTFKNESVVVARMMEEYTYTPYGFNDYKVTVVYRAQYILKDISALNSFSTLSKNNDLKRYELKQIKPNGKVNVIYEYFNVNYPEDGYEKLGDDEEDEKKKEEIPLENLELGDIIDYKYEFTYTTKTKDFKKVLLKNGKYDKVPAEVYNRNPYKYLLFKNKFIENSYAMASSVLLMHVPNELKLIQKTFNGDYKFTAKSASGKTTYECLLTHVKSFKSEEFSYFYLHHPVIKYALIQTATEKQAFFPFQFNDENPDAADVAALGRKFYLDKKYIPKYLYYLNTQSGGEAYHEASLSKFFAAFQKTFTKKDKDKYSKLNKLHEYLTNEDDLNEKPFGEIAYAVIMARFCDKLGIPYKMMACLHKYDGKWNDVISPYEITWGLYLPMKNGRDLYVTSYEEESNIYQRFGSLAGTELIVFDPKSEKNTHNIITYPPVPANENLYEQHADIVISDDTAFEYTFVNTYSMTGQQKAVISDYIKSQFDHEDLSTPYKFFGLVNYNDLYNWKEFSSNDEWIEEYLRLDSSYRMYFKGYYKDRMLAFLYNEYQFRDIEIDSNRIFEEGNFPDDESKPYGFKAVFKVKGLLESGFNDSLKVLNLGRLMTEQYQIADYKVNERFCDVYNSNLKEIRWHNSIEIPEGYECVNLEDFNTTFENEAGIFKTSAVIKDGNIIFNIEKIYKTHFLPKEKWMDMVSFLQMAEHMFMQKLLLKKK